MDGDILGFVISREDYYKYLELKRRDTPMKKIKDKNRNLLRCPVCNYVVDNAIPKQNYCDRCGQKLK